MFTGDERDAETDLDHAWFRQYSNAQARWLTPDPAGLAAVDPSNPQSWNRFAYVVGNPVSLIDPFGLCQKGWICVTSWGNGGGGPTGPIFPLGSSPFGGGAPGDINAEAQIFARNPSGGSRCGIPPFLPCRSSGPSILTPAEGATKFCEDHGQVASTIRGTDIPITASLSGTLGPVNYNTKNEITPVIPAFPWPEWLSFGAGVDVGINVPTGSAPSWSVGLGKNLGVSFFTNALGKTTGVNLNIGLSVGPPVSVSPGSVNECGRRAGG